MKRLLSWFLLALFLSVLTPLASAQERPGRESETSFEREREFERSMDSERSISRGILRSNIYRILQRDKLSRTPESFKRAQAAMAFLSLDEPRGGLEDQPVLSRLVGDGALYRFEALMKASASQTASDAYPEFQIPKVPAGVVVFDGVPTNGAQFAARFGRQMTAQDGADLNAFRQTLSQSPIFRSSSMNQAMARPERLMLIVAHNEYGRIVNGQGQSLSLSDVSSRCAMAMKLCWFLVCRSQHIVGEHGIGMVGEINVRRAAGLVSDLANLAARSATDSEGNLLLPFTVIHAMMQRVDSEGGLMRLVGYRVGEMFSVRIIVIIPNCQNQQHC